MSTITTTNAQTQPVPASPWWEIVLVMSASLIISLAVPNLKTAAVLLPLAYLLIEHFLRRRSWKSAGFDRKTVPAGLVRNLGWILLVGVVTQALAVFGAYYLLPGYFEHVASRLPFELNGLSAALVISLLISTLGEEIIFRALFQNRLSEFMPVWAAIVISSLVFALMHYAPGPFLIVFIDLALIVVDSIIYGLIFTRSKNVFVAWAAHFLADISGLVFLLLLVK